MNIRVIREPTINHATLGVCFVDDRFVCFSLEDPVRERIGKPVEAWKVPGETAIPQGRYQVILTHSPKFKRELPLLLGVPGFFGIRIHPLNVPKETDGCIGLGLTRGEGTIGRSGAACELVQKMIRAARDAGDLVWLLVENPPSWQG